MSNAELNLLVAGFGIGSTLHSINVGNPWWMSTLCAVTTIVNFMIWKTLR